MAIALDFGTCNTVVARWNEALGDVEVPFFPNLSKRYPLPGGGTASVIPSLIHYGREDQRTVGARVEEEGLATQRATFRWLKTDLLRTHGANKGRRVNGQTVYPQQAGRELLDRLLLFVRGRFDEPDQELVVTVPVGAFDPYLECLREAASSHFPAGVRVLDEATACILGYLDHVRDNQAYAVVDFGGGTLDVSVVRTDLQAEGNSKCRLLGRAGEELGGVLVDQWILEWVQKTEKLSEQDVADMGTALLAAVERAKIEVSNGEPEATIEHYNDATGRLVSCTLTREVLAGLLRQRRAFDSPSFYQMVTRTLDEAFDNAAVHGLRRADLQGVFLVGGTSRLLGVAEHIENCFPNCPVQGGNPFEAVARGACRYAGEDFSPVLVHEYLVKGWDRHLRDYRDEPIVPKGTPYPTERPVTTRYLMAACEGACSLDLVVYERSAMERPVITYVEGPNGLEAVQQGTRLENRERALNPEQRGFIQADPPCESGERRFVVGFGVNANRLLTVSLKDLKPDNSSYALLPDGTRVPLPVRDLPLVKLR